MNYLAHLLLSPPDPAFRVGNLLPDLLNLTQLEGFEGSYRAGIERHRQIDAFTDAHPMTRRSRERLWPDYRRFSGVIVDIVYDHCLIQRWADYHPGMLEDFLAEVRGSLEPLRPDLPEKTYGHIFSITQWAGDYSTLEGVSKAMTRVGQRLRKPVEFPGLHQALQKNRAGFLEDFDRFFPDLVQGTSGR